MEDALRQNLLIVSAAYCQARGMQLTTVGRKAAGDWRFFTRLAGGADFTARKYETVMAWFSRQWPDAEWPAQVPRPEAADLAA